ncbi:rhomboid-related protein 2-like isoform X2 [Contarinia nasturtii]|uniref:rhomboid-related protein 2-like isoform X2 n=1 Tax=Contarinia nasturtii TaxID=265458 RepID=UPI0012D3ADBA|nr:rhomboid-related protein 2-like isoform X2 [Contarinia nasturtii]
MAQQTIQMQRLNSGYDREGLQRLQQEIDQEQYNLQRMTSEEERADRRKMRELFDALDRNHDGVLNIRELKNHIKSYPCRNLPDYLEKHILRMSDSDGDEVLNFEEFYQLSLQQEWLFSRLVFKYCKMIVPSPHRPDEADETDGAYERSMKVCPPPLTMITFSIVEIIMFLFDIIYFSEDVHNYKAVGENTNGPAASLFIYNPHLRVEAWRFVTYMFVHVGVMHILMNLIIQIFLGVALELVHHWWRVALVYLAGVLAGSMGTSIANPNIYLAGASGGVYALITAHIATIIMNWKEMEYAIVQLFVFLVFCVTDLGFSVYRQVNDIHDQVGYVAHLCGAVAGLLVGIGVLRNLKVRRWERWLWWCAVTLYFLLMIVGISIHIFYADHFPKYKPLKGNYW